MDGVFKILIASPDEEKGSLLSSKIKKAFGKLPLKIDFASDGEKALGEFNIKSHGLIISDINMPVMDGLTLLKEIRKTEGTSFVFFLYEGTFETPDETGVEAFKWPITNWTDFVHKVQDVIPEELKSEYGLSFRDTILYKKLAEYGEKYHSAGDSCLLANTPITFFPHHFVSKESARREPTKEEKIAEKMQKFSEDKTVLQEDKGHTSIILWIIELLILGGLLALTLYLFKESKAPGGEDDFMMEESLLSLKNIMAGITGVAFFGFFISRFLEFYFRFWTRIKK